jgi:transposase
MARKRLSMRQIRQVLRLRLEHGLPTRAVARACSVGLGTVTEYLTRAQRAGLSWPLPEGLDDGALEALLYPPSAEAVGPRPLPDFPSIHQELKRPGVTLLLLWLEYLKDHPGGYQYSQFCDRYRRWARHLNPSMRQIHRAGEKAFVDFAGQKPTLVDPQTGEVTEVELFVGTLGASSYLYAEAVPSQELSCWIGAHVRMLEEWGGCPAILVPDNLKSGITKPCRYEPEVNRTYEEMAGHYGAVVIPARVGHPKDKPKAEVSVQIAERWILAVLRHRTFFSLAEMNAAIRQCREAINDRPMQKLGVSRRQLFAELDRPALKPLPPTRYEMAHWKGCTVSIDYHIELERNYYSVPYQLLHERVEARYTASTVEVYFKSRRVASHLRLFGRGQVSTDPAHMPASHRTHREWSPSRIVAWAEKNGPATGRVVARILESRPHPEQGFRSCLGILRLAKSYEPERVEAACHRADALGTASYRIVKNILSAGLDRLPVEEEAESLNLVPEHENIRGAEYYAEKERGC